MKHSRITRLAVVATLLAALIAGVGAQAAVSAQAFQGSVDARPPGYKHDTRSLTRV